MYKAASGRRTQCQREWAREVESCSSRILHRAQTAVLSAPLKPGWHLLKVLCAFSVAYIGYCVRRAVWHRNRTKAFQPRERQRNMAIQSNRNVKMTCNQKMRLQDSEHRK